MEAYRGQFALIEEYNEEKCRDFLVHELGVEIPRFYRYAEGIHEVQKRIILRYGDENFAKAMGIFTHLLESDDNAAGLGDDGDLWRSWRHDYKLRGEDYANPGTPRFSGLILPAVQPPRRSYTPLVVAAAQNQRFDPESSSNRVNKHDAASGRARDSKEGNSLALATATPASLNIPALAKETVEISMVSSNACPMKGSKTFKAGLRRMVATNLSSLFPTVKEEEDEEDEDKPPPVPPKDNTPPSHNKNPPPPSSPRLPPLCFDGACDMPDFRDDPFSTSSGASDPIDNNRRSIHSLMDHKASERTKRPVDCSFPTSATSSSNLSSAISSATYSTASGKDGFRNLARDLLNTNRSDVSSSMLGNFSALDPAKYSPPASTTTPMDAIDPYLRYASVAVSNPFMEDRATHWPAITEEQARLLTYTPYQSPDKPKGMSQSQSEANIAYLGGQSPGEYPSSRDSSTLHDSADLSPTRGRSKSPVKYHLDDIREDVVVEVPQSVGKRSRSPMKKMFGENGWLGRSTSLREMPDEQYRKTGLKHWGGKIKQRVEGLTEDMTKLLPNPFGNEVPERSPTQSKFPISLTPPAQSKLYSEIELMICVTANTYLMGQRREGRMSVESLLKITEFWKSKGRPQVIEFQYDQATQRDLVLYNIKTFRFFGQHAENSISINSMLYNWKSLAKEMSVRTFCTPDSVIRKHLHDIYKILELLGAPLTTFLAFQEIQVKALKTIRDEQMMRAEKAQIQYGVERAWYPPASASANPDGASHIDLNAFEG